MFHRLAAQNLNVNVVQQYIASVIRYSKGKKQIFWYSLFDRPESGFVRVKNIWLVIMTGDQLSVIFSPDMCSLPRKHMTLQHISLVICVPLPRKHTLQGNFVPLSRKKKIPGDMCSSTQEPHITSDRCSPSQKTQISKDMCCPKQQTCNH